MGAWTRLIGALTASLLLASCLLTPGKFTSKLVLNADRGFTYSYLGEVHALDPESSMRQAADDPNKGSPAKKAEAEAKNRAIADALTKEAGYRSVRYLGEGKFLIDYQVSGTLTHNFVYPFNVDAQAIVPFIAAELRANGTVRVKAPGFANENKGEMGRMSNDPSGDKLDGSFVLETDAEIVSTNNEDGAATAGARKTLSWKVTPLTRDAPTAVLRLRP